MKARNFLKRLFTSAKQQEFIDLELKHGAHNYKPIPIVISKGKGIYVWDVDGNKYQDFLSGYSALNQGHSHPKIYQTLCDQAKTLALTSRAVYNDKLGLAEKYFTELFGYDKILFSSSGVEACEGAVKFSRRWGYRVKNIPTDKAKVLFAYGNFWGRSLAACASSEDPNRYKDFGPYNLNFELVAYNDVNQLRKALEADPNVTAVMLEPIQGEKGVIIPDDDYLLNVRKLCDQFNCLFICDEIQAGLGRTGKLLDHYHSGVRPDIVTLGKALSGGIYPVSAFIADDQIMLQVRPGEHGSTYGGNPLAVEVAMTATKVLIEEGMIENSAKMGKYLLEGLNTIDHEAIIERRGRGLFCASKLKYKIVQLAENERFNANKLSQLMAKNGLIAKATHGDTIRFSPPLVITKQQVEQAVEIIKKSFKEL